MPWTVELLPRANKKIRSLPKKVREALVILIRDIESHGPVRGNWPNYGKLGPDRHHCHLKKGKPVYVAVWEVKERQIRLVEITYVGTHEKAPY
jgi:mRNA-degrading endonuclease RelE of RelBE toxin-antitoxin system